MSYPSNPCQVPVPTTTLFERVFRMNRYSDIFESLFFVFAIVFTTVLLFDIFFGIVICLVRSCHLITLNRMTTEQRRHFCAAMKPLLTFVILICLKQFIDLTTDPLLQSILKMLGVLLAVFAILSVLVFGFTEIRRNEREHYETTPLIRRGHRLPSYQSLFFGDQVNIIIIVLITILMLINPNTATSLQ